MNITSLTQSPLFQQVILGNTIWRYCLALLITGLVALGSRVFLSYVIAKLQQVSKYTKNQYDDLLIKMVRSIHSRFFSFIALYTGTQFLSVHPNINRSMLAILVIWSVFQVIRITQMLIDFFGQKFLEKDGGEAESAIAALKLMTKILLWSAGSLLVLSNLGIDITSLIAGLGIGGIAVALALQNILGDLLSSFAIYFDKPFEIGDFIVVGDTLGTVEKIGIKTTRIKALQGEEIVVPNQTLTSSKIQNFKKMNKRRICFTFGVAYETPHKALQGIPKIVNQIIDDQSDAEFDRAHLKEFCASSLDYEVIYYVTSPDYERYMDTQQAINLAILKAFEDQKIEIAYPTRTVYLKK